MNIPVDIEGDTPSTSNGYSVRDEEGEQVHVEVVQQIRAAQPGLQDLDVCIYYLK